MWIKDPKTGQKSVTVTLLSVGFGVALVKLLFAEATIGSFKMGAFAASDFAIIVGSVGGLYWGRKHTDKEK